MKRCDRFHIDVLWGPRRETSDSLALRVRQLVDRLRVIDPIVAHWYNWVSETKAVSVDFEHTALAKEIANRISRDDFGEPEPVNGYYFSAVNNDKGGFSSRGLTLLMHGGSLGQNFVGLNSDPDFTPDPDILTYPIFKAALLAMGETFEPDWGSAESSSLREFWAPVPRGRGPMLQLSWMTYVSPKLSHLITPPPSAIVERRPDGGLLMAATDETFSTSNPAHLAVANDILAAVAPINALGWPPEIEPAG
jgi:hypothetical protein